MQKTYYRNEYTEKQWKALIDKATELGCHVTYSKYGTRAEIDSTERENGVLQSTGKSIDDCAARSFWAEHIHQMLQESTDLRRWKVQPKKYRQRRKFNNNSKIYRKMVTVKFSTNKLNSGEFLIFPTILVDKSEKKTKAAIAICFAWINSLFEVGIKWSRKVTN